MSAATETTTTGSAVVAPSEFRATHRYARMPARKARLIAGLIRGLSVNQALEQLQFSPKRAAVYYLKVLKSAVANAGQDENVNVNRLYLADCRADDGPLLQNRLRYRPGPQGRAMPIRKRTCHITIALRETQAEESPSAAPKKRKSAKKSEQKG